MPIGSVFRASRWRHSDDSRSLSVAIFLPSFAIGGVETVLLNLAQGFAQCGHGVELVVVDADRFEGRSLPPSIKVIDLKAKQMRWSVVPLARYLGRERPDVLLSGKTYANVAASVSVRVCRVGIYHIVTEHSKYQFDETAGRFDRCLWILAKWAYRRADAIVAVSGDVAASLSTRLGLNLASIQVIANPVVTEDFPQRSESRHLERPLDVERPVVLGVGRLVPEKGFADLIRAMHVVNAQRECPAALVILGEGPLRAPLERLIDDLGMSSSVTLYGEVDDCLPYMSGSSVFVLSSHSEGFPVSLVEALYCGCRIVATTCSDAIDTILEGGRFGNLVPVGDPGALSSGITAALDASVDVEGQRASASRYSLDSIMRQYNRLIHDSRME